MVATYGEATAAVVRWHAQGIGTYADADPEDARKAVLDAYQEALDENENTEWYLTQARSARRG